MDMLTKTRSSAPTMTLCALFAAVLAACGGGNSDAGKPAEATPLASNLTAEAPVVAVTNADAATDVEALAVRATTTVSKTTALAKEGSSFSVTGTQLVRYGADSRWVQKLVTGSAQCTNGFFGNDPASGTVKSCELIVVAAPVAGQTLAPEGGSFSVSGASIVRYGADSRWVQKLVTGPAQCTNEFFGNDPAVGTVKSCEMVSVGAKLANEGGSFAVSGSKTVRYGADSRWVQKLVTGSGQCTNDFFGNDPAFGTVKSCELMDVATTQPTPLLVEAPAPAVTTSPVNASSTSTPAPTATPAGGTVTAWVRLAMEGESFTTAGSQTVRFGDGTRWVNKVALEQGVCSVSFFGADPVSGIEKFCEVQMTVPAVLQTGAAPVVNLALLPKPGKPHDTARLRAITALELTAAWAQPSLADIGAFREACHFSHMAADDPIVSPNRAGASHMHTFFGNASANATSTGESLMAAGDSSCDGGTLNRTAYWMPSLIDIRTGQPLVPTSSNFYYKLGYLGVKTGSVQTFPKGLRMVAGDSSNTKPIKVFYMGLECVSGGGHMPSIPDCAIGDTLNISIVFPQCWDGTNLDSPDHKSHMAYATGNGCPTTHPVALPEIAVNVGYKVTENKISTFWKLSSDNYIGPGGYSVHADWFNGWDPSVNKRFVQNCINSRMDCGNRLLGDGSMLY